MELATLVEASARISATAGKKGKVALIAALLRQARGKEISLAADYLSGQLPQGRLGVGGRMLAEAGTSRDAASAPAPFTLAELDDVLTGVAKEAGPGSTERKLRSLRAIFSCCASRERDFLSGLVLEAIAQASALGEREVRQAFMFASGIGEVARAALEEGAAGLSRFGPRLFHPISPMLASPAEGEEEAVERSEEADTIQRVREIFAGDVVE